MSETPVALDQEKIPKLLFRYAMPSIISMTASAVYNIVDSMFVGQGVGAYAISGFALTLPVMNLAAAFGSLVGIGSSSLVAVKLGQRDSVTATKALGNAVSLNCIIGVAFTILALLFLDPVLRFFGASSLTLPYAREYMQVILAGNVITHVYLGLNDNLRASGYPRKAMKATLSAVLINCILDPLFIFGFHWGLRGAALATVIAQLVALIYVLRHYGKRSSTLHFQRGIFKLRKDLVKGILSVGMSPFLMNACSCLIIIIINKSLYKYGGDLSIGAYGIANRVVSFFFMLCMGITQGMQPLVGYNYGAKKYDRIIKLLNLTMLYTSIITTLTFIVYECFPYAIVSVFTTHPELAAKAAEGIRIDVAAFFLVSIPVVTASFFQALRKPGKAIFLSLTRQLLFLIPLLLILPPFLGVRGVWASLPISDCISAVIAVILLTKQIKIFKSLSKQQNGLEQTPAY